jgi:hypothetical protein
MKKLLVILIALNFIIFSATVSAVPYKNDIVKIEFIHYNDVKSIKSAKVVTPKCYNTLGANYYTYPLDYVINPTNPYGLTNNFVKSSLYSSAETWDSKTSINLFNDNPAIDYSAQYGVMDLKNSLVFGDYPDDRVIAVTSLWISAKKKRILEFDIEFNTRFRWGDATNPPTNTNCTQWEQQCSWWYNECAQWDNITYENGTVEEVCTEWRPACGDLQDVCANWQTDIIPIMDLQNIATHEFGHAVGLDDVYENACSEVTMYGYSTEMETKKRTLEQPDIKGFLTIYP